MQKYNQNMVPGYQTSFDGSRIDEAKNDACSGM